MPRLRAPSRAPLTVLLAVLLAAALVLGLPGPAARADTTPCRGTTTAPPVVLVHDLLGTPASVSGLAAVLAADGRCVVAEAWGPAPALAPVLPLLSNLLPAVVSNLPGGLASMEQAAPALSRRVTATAATAPAREVDVVAVGAGSLLALRSVQLTPGLPVRRLVSVGSLWDGTNLAGLGDLEQLSRDAGTYDLVLGVEKLLMDGACASCRELIKGSDFLRGLQAAGLRPAGLQQVDVVSRTDGLVVPWTSGVRDGVSTLVVQEHDPAARSSHFALPRDPVVQGLVRAALR